jgi:cell division protein FtsB
MIKFLKNQWFSILIILLLVIIQVSSDKQIVAYKERLRKLELQIEAYEKSDAILRQKVDSLSSLEKEVIKEIETIKEKEYVQVKVVDSIPVSKLQQFFTDRYQE